MQLTTGDVVTVHGLKYSEERPGGQFLGFWEGRDGRQTREFLEHVWPLTVDNPQEGLELTVVDFPDNGVLCEWPDGDETRQAVFPAAVLRRKPSLSDLGATLA